MTQSEIDSLADALAERLAGRLGAETADQVGDVRDAARWLNCSVPTVERQTRAGKIPSMKVGRLRRYRLADLLSLTTMGGCNHGE